jgi:assimilatory nitrate reductase catalytic subunit
MTLTVPEVVGPGAARVVVTPREFPTNAGGLCQKGWTSTRVLEAPDRLTQPLVRRDGVLQPASWQDALTLVADRVRALQDKHGTDCVGVFGGGGLTNEKAYMLGKFARLALRTRYIDYNGRFCMSSAASAGNAAFGIDRGLPFPLTDLGGAQAILLVGGNPSETMPPLVRHLASARRQGGLIVVDPRRTATAALAEDGAGLHLQPLPGTDVELLLGILHAVFAAGEADAGYLSERVSGADDVRRSVAMYWPERVERDTGVPATHIREAARLLAAASPRRGGTGAYVLTGRGAEQHAHGTDTVSAAINLALALGLPGRVGSGYGCITGQGNGQGGREHGQKCDQLPGYRSITDPAARAHVAAVWGVPESAIPGPGVPAMKLFARLAEPDGIRALFVHGSNLAVSVPDATDLMRRLGELDLLVVCDFFVSETALLADVVLPVMQWAEEEGTMTSLEGRVLRRRRAVRAPEGVRDELRVWHDLAGLLSCDAAFPTSPALVLAELRRASAGGIADYSGISLERLDAGEALFWPCPDEKHPGTPRMFLDRFGTPDGRAVMRPVAPTAVADDVRPGAPRYRITRRVMEHYQSGTQTRRVPELLEASPHSFVQINPMTAARLGICDGDAVEVTSARGSCVAPARLSEDLRPEVVFMPFHYPGAESANAVTNPAADPISGMPEVKVCAVSIRARGEVDAPAG